MNTRPAKPPKKQSLLQFQKLQQFVFNEVDTAVKLAETNLQTDHLDP